MTSPGQFTVWVPQSHTWLPARAGRGLEGVPAHPQALAPTAGRRGRPASCKGRAGHRPSSQPESEQPGPPLLPPRALSLSSAGPEEVGWAQQRRGCHGVGPVGGWAGLVRGTCLTCRCQDVGRAASPERILSFSLSPGVSFLPVPIVLQICRPLVLCSQVYWL